MPKRASDDIDHVPIEPPAKKHKKAPQNSGSYLSSNLKLLLELPLMAMAFVAFHFVIIYGAGRIILMRFSNGGVGGVWRGKVWWGSLPLKRARSLAAEGIMHHSNLPCA